jgi:ParB family chromosome partitioning protein
MVRLNPPYSQPAISQFAEKLASEWEAGHLQSAIALTHNYTDTGWFHRLASSCRAICFTRGRIGFINPEGKKASPTQGQAFFYFGREVDQFIEQFGEIGFVVEVRS